MKRMILVCCLCLAATPVYAEDNAWLTDEKTGCKIITMSNKKDSFPDLSLSWSGICKNKKADGEGVIKVYTKKEGQNVAIIKGILKNGECVGEISIKYVADNIKYTGESKNCFTPNGNGVKTRLDGLSYSGKFKDGYLEKGTINYPTISSGYAKLGYSIYTGEAGGHQPHGQGIMIYKNGDKYSGGWSEGKQHGKGTYTFKDGTSYEGLWEHGERIKIF